MTISPTPKNEGYLCGVDTKNIIKLGICVSILGSPCFGKLQFRSQHFWLRPLQELRLRLHAKAFRASHHRITAVPPWPESKEVPKLQLNPKPKTPTNLECRKEIVAINAWNCRFFKRWVRQSLSWTPHTNRPLNPM